MPQRLYLQFLCAKRAVCSGVPKFAAYFRVVIPEVRGKIEIGRPDTGFGHLRPAVLLKKNLVVLIKFRFFPALPKTTIRKPTVIKRKRDKYPLESSP